MMMSMSLDTSAWNSNFSAEFLRVFLEIDSDSLHTPKPHYQCKCQKHDKWKPSAMIRVSCAPLDNLGVGGQAMGNSPKLLLYLGQIGQLVAALLGIDLEPLSCSTSRRVRR
jgi:hypothetical protein